MPRFASSHPEHQVYEDAVILAPVATQTVDGNGAAFKMPDCQAMIGILETFAFGTDAADTFDCYVQTYIGGDWIDVLRFTRIVGIGGDKTLTYIGKIINPLLVEAMFEEGTALGFSTVRHLHGTQWRARWEIVDGAPGAGDQTWTFSVKIQPMGTLYGPIRRPPNRA